jgi:hypothetical protein
MTDIVLQDIDPVLADRIRGLAQARGWGMHETLLKLIEHGLYHCEDADAAGNFDSREAGVLQAAIAALEQVPDDAGFALIGRVEAAPEQDEADADAGIFDLDRRRLF